ncbi:MAG: PsbP-related protein [Methanobacterium sp.]
MKKYLLIVILISALVLSSGCTNGGNQTSGSSNNKTKTFSGDDITFKYPDSWQTIASQARDSVVAVGDPGTNDGSGNTRVNVVIQKTVLPQGQNFFQYYNSTYAQFASQNLGFVPISDGTIVVNGLNAYEKVYNINSGEKKQQRAIWIENNGRIYIILCSAPLSEYNNQQENFNTIVNSFTFQ